MAVASYPIMVDIFCIYAHSQMNLYFLTVINPQNLGLSTKFALLLQLINQRTLDEERIAETLWNPWKKFDIGL